MRFRRMLSRVCVPPVLVGTLYFTEPAARADPRDDAAMHFNAGVRAFEERRFADAALEFESAYGLSPAWVVLYNLGSVYAALGRPVDSVDAFERYLADGGSKIDDVRRREVETEIARQRAKIAVVELSVNAAKAEIRVDSRLAGYSPLPQPLRLTEGAHVVEVRLEGGSPERRELVLRGGQRTVLTFALFAERAPAPVRARAVEPAPPPSAPAPATSHVVTSSNGTAQRIVGYSVGGLGLVGVGVGIAICAKGQSKHLDAVDVANAGDRPRAEAMESAAEHQKNLGYATIGIGGAAVLGGLVLLVTAPSGTSTHSVSAPVFWASPSAGGLGWKGTW